MLFFKWGIFVLIFTECTFKIKKLVLTLGFELAISCVVNGSSTGCATVTGFVII